MALERVVAVVRHRLTDATQNHTRELILSADAARCLAPRGKESMRKLVESQYLTIKVRSGPAIA